MQVHRKPLPFDHSHQHPVLPLPGAAAGAVRPPGGPRDLRPRGATGGRRAGQGRYGPLGAHGGARGASPPRVRPSRRG